MTNIVDQQDGRSGKDNGGGACHGWSGHPHVNGPFVGFTRYNQVRIAEKVPPRTELGRR